MTQPSTPFTTDAVRWPEQLRNTAPSHERFPWLMIVLWLLPGFLLTAALFGATFYLESRASKQVLYILPNGHLGVVRADGIGAHEIALTGFETRNFSGSMPVWSPTGNQWAIRSNAGDFLVAPGGTTDITPKPMAVEDGSDISMIGQPWSFDGTYIATLATKNNQMSLRIDDVGQQRPTMVDIRPSPSIPLNWNPVRNELLTTVMSGTNPLALRVVTPDGQVRPFEPNDQQTARMFGAWSPDGARVAYSASTKAAQQSASIWIANSDGANPTQIVGDGYNTAPVWAPNGDALFFTRIITDSQPYKYDVYRVQTDGQQLVRIGGSTAPNLMAQQGRATLIDWSPDGQFMYFQADEDGQRSVYVALADGSNAERITSTPTSSRPVIAHWSPTSRGVLVATGDTTQVYWCKDWFDTSRRTLFPTSLTPAWQP